MSAPLSTTRTVANTAAEHIADHTALHAFFNLVGGMSMVTKTTDYTLTANDYLVIMNGASKTATLPDATSASSLNRYYVVKNIHATAATLASLGGNIDGASTQPINQYNALTVVSDGTQWLIV